MSHKSEWVSYILGALLTLLYKLGKAIYLGKLEGKETPAIICDWFFSPTSDNVTSWIATFGGVWVIGSLYIQRIGLPTLEWLASVPIVDSFAFFLGCIAEMAVPALTKKVVNRIVGEQP